MERWWGQTESDMWAVLPLLGVADGKSVRTLGRSMSLSDYVLKGRSGGFKAKKRTHHGVPLRALNVIIF